VSLGVEGQPFEPHARGRPGGGALQLEGGAGTARQVLVHLPGGQVADRRIEPCIDLLRGAQVRRRPVRSLLDLAELDPERLLRDGHQRPRTGLARRAPDAAIDQAGQLLRADDVFRADPGGLEHAEIEARVMDQQLPIPEPGQGLERAVAEIDQPCLARGRVVDRDDPDLRAQRIERRPVLELGLMGTDAALSGDPQGRSTQPVLGPRLGLEIDRDGRRQGGDHGARLVGVDHLLELDAELIEERLAGIAVGIGEQALAQCGEIGAQQKRILLGQRLGVAQLELGAGGDELDAARERRLEHRGDRIGARPGDAGADGSQGKHFIVPARPATYDRTGLCRHCAVPSQLLPGTRTDSHGVPLRRNTGHNETPGF
jgi:hypothetical protein